MEKETITYSQILKCEILLRLTKEKNLIVLFMLALFYSIISNIISRCCPIECAAEFANIGNATDEFLRNICYSIVAGVIFYFINDTYRNVVRRISELDNMFFQLLTLYTDATNMLSTISHNNYKSSMDKKQAYQCVIKNICDEDVEFQMFGNPYKNHTIKVEDCVLLVNNWKGASKECSDFLGAYGDLLERNETYRLNCFDDNLVRDIINSLDKLIEDSNNEHVQVSDYDITVLINRIIVYKQYVTKLTKKYVHYHYSDPRLNRLCEEQGIV